LRDAKVTVAELLRVEPAASWSEYGSPSTAYIALADRHAGRLLPDSTTRRRRGVKHPCPMTVSMHSARSISILRRARS